MHPDLNLAEKLTYLPSGLKISEFLKEKESQEYAASTFHLNDKKIKFRIGKITPTKIGQFVTLWKRIGNGPIIPYDLIDPFDFYVISVRSGTKLGQFVFPKEALQKHGILSKDGKGGKRAMRIYPSWDIAENVQAKKSQEWQLEFFFEMSQDKPLNYSKIQELFAF